MSENAKTVEDRAKKFLERNRINTNQIVRIQREDGKTQLHLLDGSSVGTFIPVKTFVDYLPEDSFVCVNKCVVLAVSQIVEVVGGVYRMADGTTFAGRAKQRKGHHKVAEMVKAAQEDENGTGISSVSLARSLNSRSFADTLLRGCSKVLRVDLLKDEFIVVKDDEAVVSSDVPETLSGWLEKFIAAGRVHEDDLDQFTKGSSLQAMTSYLMTCEIGTPYYLRYRRLTKGEFRWTLMEAVALKIQEDSLIANIYVRDVHAAMVEDSAPNRQEFDELTGLLSFDSFVRVASEIVRSDAVGYYRILCAGIQDFKYVNERLGLTQCDQLLYRLAQTLRKESPGYVLGGRLAGDSFIFLLRGASLAQVEGALDSVSRWEREAGTRVFFGLSKVDIAASFEDNCSRANMALRLAREKMTIRIAEYSDDMDHAMNLKVQVLADADRGFSNKEFRVRYLPKIDPNTLQLCGSEALVRWLHPELGEINGADFLPAFEENGLIRRLDSYVCNEVCQDMSRWIAQGFDPVPVSINLSRFDFSQSGLADHLISLIDKYGLPHTLVGFELTAWAFAENPDAVKNEIEKLREAGFVVELDDFGAGYSAVESLTELDFDAVKLDRSVVKNMFSNKGKVAMSALVGLAKDLGLNIVAEGVEKQKQLDELREYGCNVAQGFLFSTPLTSDDYEKRFDNVSFKK